MKLTGNKVLVTGATGGIGQAIAAAAAAKGAQVVVTGRRTDVLQKIADKLGATAITADLGDRDQVAALLEQAGHPEIVVANAALPGSGPLLEYDVDQIDRAIEVNLRAPIVLARLAAERMADRKKGHLVFINSLSGKTASAAAAMYNATKFGLRGFALALREDMRPYGVGVSTVFPGFIRDAGMFADSGVELPPGVGTRTPEDVARAVVRAVERNLGEVDVAPLPMRLGTRVGTVAPGLSARVQRLVGGDRITRDLAAGQRDKR